MEMSFPILLLNMNYVINNPPHPNHKLLTIELDLWEQQSETKYTAHSRSSAKSQLFSHTNNCICPSQHLLCIHNSMQPAIYILQI